jgi:Uroporphyrinogen-III decarboxylase
MTEKENALLAIHHIKPKWVPNFYDAYYPFASSLINNQGERGRGGLDMFGVNWLVTPDTGYEAIPSPFDHILDDITKWKDIIKFPDLDNMDWAAAAKKDLEGYDRDSKLLCLYSMEGNFNRLESFLGVEDAMVAMYLEPEAVMELLNAYTEFKIRQIEKYAKYYKPDIYVNGDDVASSDGLFFSPDLYREMFKPFETRLAQAAIAHGMIVEHHVCGKVDEIIPDIIETGASIWQTAQKMNDLSEIKRKYGDKLCIHGGWDSTGRCSMDDASEEEIRAEVRRCIDTYAEDGNYMLFPIIIGDPVNSNLQQRRSWCADECKKYGKKFYK